MVSTRCVPRSPTSGWVRARVNLNTLLNSWVGIGVVKLKPKPTFCLALSKLRALSLQCLVMLDNVILGVHVWTSEQRNAQQLITTISVVTIRVIRMQ